MEINLTIRGEEKFRAFVEEHALIGYDAARSDLEEQFLADEKAGRYVLAPEKAKDGQEHVKPCMGSATTRGAEMLTGADTGKPSLSTPSCLRA